GKREPCRSAHSIHYAALAIAKDTLGCSIERNLINLVRVKSRDIEPVLAKAKMAQPFFGHRHKLFDRTLRVNLQYFVVSEIRDVEITLSIEGNSVRTLEKVTLREDGDGV